MPKISALTSLAQASVDTAADVLPIVDATAPATTKNVTVQAMVNAGLATLTTLPSGIVNASLNSITPTGGTLTVDGSISATVTGSQASIFAGADGVYSSWSNLGTLIGDVGTGDRVISEGSAADFGINARGGDLLFGTNFVQRLKLSSAGATVTGSISATSLVDISAAGAGQIKFPATQNASADANTLDDYEERRFDPVLTNDTGDTVTSYYWQRGTCVKIGKTVFFDIQISVNVVGVSSGTMRISGLPYTLGADDSLGAQTYVTMLGIKNSGSGPAVIAGHIQQPIGTEILLYQAASFGTPLPYTEVTSGGQFYLQGHYTAAADVLPI